MGKCALYRAVGFPHVPCALVTTLDHRRLSLPSPLSLYTGLSNSHRLLHSLLPTCSFLLLPLSGLMFDPLRLLCLAFGSALILVGLKKSSRGRARGSFCETQTSNLITHPVTSSISLPAANPAGRRSGDSVTSP